MPKFVIERTIPGAGQLTPEQLTAISQTSCGGAGSRYGSRRIQWLRVVRYRR